MISPVTRSRTVTVTEQVYILSGPDIIDLLIERRVLDEAQRDRTSVSFEVPGGGDWSNTLVDIDADNPIVVTVTDRKETTS